LPARFTVRVNCGKGGKEPLKVILRVYGPVSCTFGKAELARMI
jgi:hypothetical protein